LFAFFSPKLDDRCSVECLDVLWADLSRQHLVWPKEFGHFDGGPDCRRPSERQSCVFSSTKRFFSQLKQEIEVGTSSERVQSMVENCVAGQSQGDLLNSQALQILQMPRSSRTPIPSLMDPMSLSIKLGLEMNLVAILLNDLNSCLPPTSNLMLILSLMLTSMVSLTAQRQDGGNEIP